MNKSFSYHIKACLIALSAVFSVSQISACGQKGPLYLPEDKEQVETDPQQKEQTDKESQN